MSTSGASDKKTKKKHPVKGDFGYYSYEKKRRIAIVAFLFGICLMIFFTGLIMTGTRRNLLTLVAILGVLPAAKSIQHMELASARLSITRVRYLVLSSARELRELI